MNLSEKLKKVNEEIYSKFGTESYEVRCKLFDIHKEMETQEKKFNLDFVSQQRELLKFFSTKLSESLDIDVGMNYITEDDIEECLKNFNCG